MFQEAVERINRSPTQLSFPPSDSTLDMLGVILQGLVNLQNSKNCDTALRPLLLLRQPKGESMVLHACMCVSNMCVLCKANSWPTVCK